MKSRAGAVVAIAGALAVGLSGCSFMTPQATTFEYDPSDGVSASVGALDIENAMVLTADGSTGTLVATIINSDTSTDVTLGLQYEGADGKVDETVEARRGGITPIGYDGGTVVLLEGIDTPAGALLPIYVQYGTHPGSAMLVPVLDGSLPQYAELLPAG